MAETREKSIDVRLGDGPRWLSQRVLPLRPNLRRAPLRLRPTLILAPPLLLSDRLQRLRPLIAERFGAHHPPRRHRAWNRLVRHQSIAKKKKEDAYRHSTP